ncbi:nucleotidyltransferase, partial [bacterium]
MNLLEKNRDKIKQYGVKKIGIFGSYVRNEQTNISDIDIIVEF